MPRNPSPTADGIGLCAGSETAGPVTARISLDSLAVNCLEAHSAQVRLRWILTAHVAGLAYWLTNQRVLCVCTSVRMCVCNVCVHSIARRVAQTV
jgi:uncharacterized membrane protein YcfT